MPFAGDLLPNITHDCVLPVLGFNCSHKPCFLRKNKDGALVWCLIMPLNDYCMSLQRHSPSTSTNY